MRYRDYKNFRPDNYYHIYNRGNNKQDIFLEPADYFQFIKRIKIILQQDINQTRLTQSSIKPLPKNSFVIIAYCLMQNHFHFLIKTKEHSGLVSEQFRKFFSLYAQKVNEQTGRSGSLFLKPFRRKIIINENYLQRLIFYIHYNPVYHNISKTFENYNWSSYKRVLDQKKTNLQKEKVLELFNGREGYIDFHQNMHDLKAIREFIIE